MFGPVRAVSTQITSSGTTLVVLRDRVRVRVRPIEQADHYELQRAFELLSDESRYRRFHTGTARLSDRLARYFTRVDHEALIALASESSTCIIGVGRYIRHGPGSPEADLAVTVADRWQGRGLATALVDLLSDRARAVGIERFTVDVLHENSAVQALVTSAGGVLGDRDGAVLSGHLELHPDTFTVPASTVLEAAATGRVVNVPAPLRAELPDLPATVRAVMQLDGHHEFPTPAGGPGGNPRV